MKLLLSVSGIGHVVRLYTNSAKEVTVLGGIAMVDPSPVLFTQHLCARVYPSIQSLKQYLSLCRPHPLGVLIGISGQYLWTKVAAEVP